MNNIRQNKIGGLILKELGVAFQREARTVCLGAMVTVTVVRVTPDLSLARVYLSVFGGPDKEEVLKNIQLNTKPLRNTLAQSVKKQLRKIPELKFSIDDTLDYAEKIDELLQ